ncbi:MAG: helix-turn-helix transcriptional regulator [Myxococcota bacterium]
MLRSFVRNTKRLMREQKRSVNMTADFAGISRGHMSLLLRGETVPNLITVARIAHALGVEPSELLRATNS